MKPDPQMEHANEDFGLNREATMICYNEPTRWAWYGPLAAWDTGEAAISKKPNAPGKEFE